MRLAAVLLALLLLLPGISARAATGPDEMLQDPALEARARALGRELRCLVCQNQSIDDSDAGLARDLRHIVREQLQAGAGDADIRAHLVARYGDFVLLRPPLGPSTWLLWFGPFAVVLLGALGILLYFRRRRPGALPAELDPAERARLDGLLAEPDRPSP